MNGVENGQGRPLWRWCCAGPAGRLDRLNRGDMRPVGLGFVLGRVYD